VEGPVPRAKRAVVDGVEEAFLRYTSGSAGLRAIQIVSPADGAGKVNCAVSIDATISRPHQRASKTERSEHDTGGMIELQGVSY
jgi:hypothetical protein